MRRATINRLLVLAGIVVFAILFRTLPVTDWLEQLARLNEQVLQMEPGRSVRGLLVERTLTSSGSTASRRASGGSPGRRGG